MHPSVLLVSLATSLSFHETHVHAFLPLRVLGTELIKYSHALHATNTKNATLIDNELTTITRSGSVNVRAGSLMAATIETGRVPYGEKSRKYRRTVFRHQDWVEHRSSSSRIISNLQSMLFSGVVRQLRPQITIITISATFVVIWNTFMSYLLSQQLLSHELNFLLNPITLPSLPFTLSSPALGLLLVFRTNAAYARWMEARNTWARMIAHSRNLVRMASVFSDDEEAVKSLARATWLYCRTVMNQLSSPEEDELLYQEEVQKVYGSSNGISSTGQRVLMSNDRTISALKQLSKEHHNLSVPDPKALIEADKSIVILGDCTSICEKIFNSPVPLVYTRHTTRFLSLWALLLPASMYTSFKDLGIIYAIIPASSILAFFLFGVDELSVQLEEPFSILPMKYFCDGVYNSTLMLADSET